MKWKQDLFSLSPGSRNSIVPRLHYDTGVYCRICVNGGTPTFQIFGQLRGMSLHPTSQRRNAIAQSVICPLTEATYSISLLLPFVNRFSNILTNFLQPQLFKHQQQHFFGTDANQQQHNNDKI
jgi:hypothetical protein